MTAAYAPSPSGFNRIEIPTAVAKMYAEGAITHRAYSVLSILLGFRNKDRTTVYPKLTTLARLCRCSVKTIQRAIDCLEAAGLVTTTYKRDTCGRITSLLFDLGNVYAMMRRPRSRTAQPPIESAAGAGEKSAAGARPASTCSPSMSYGQTDGADANQAQIGSETAAATALPKDIDGGTYVKQENAEQATEAATQHMEPDAATVRLLKKYEVNANAADRFAVLRGPAVCAQAVQYTLEQIRLGKAKNLTRYLCGLLNKDEYHKEALAALSAPDPLAVRPTPPPKAPAPQVVNQNPLDSLSAEALAALEARAHADLQGDKTSVGRAYRDYAKGSPARRRALRLKMKELLTGIGAAS